MSYRIRTIDLHGFLLGIWVKKSDFFSLRNFEIRKNLLKFDDVMNDQRKVVYEQRRELMLAEDVSEEITFMREQVIEDIVKRCIPEKAYAEQWDMSSLHGEILKIFGLDLPVIAWAKEEGIADQEIQRRLIDIAAKQMAEKVANYGPEIMRSVEKSLLLQLLDQLWKEHLLSLDHLRQGIGLRAYAQRDPLNEYKQEAFSLFEEMLEALRERVTQILSHVELQLEDPNDNFVKTNDHEMIEGRIDPALSHIDQKPEKENAITKVPFKNRRAASNMDPTDPSTWGRVSRNALCPCQSGKKFKHCHGANV